MATAGNVAGSDVAELIVDSIAGQADLLFGLSVAICGGIAALGTQIIIHNNSEGSTKIVVSGLPVAGLIFLSEGVSAFFGYLVKGTLVGAIPAIHAAEYLPGDPLMENELEPLLALQAFAFWQFMLFIGGLALLLVLIWLNRKSLR